MAMICDPNHPKVQHYVPQFILRGFTHTQHQIYVFAKDSQRVFSSNIKRVAAQSKFYDFTLDNAPHSLESYLSNMETDIAPIIKSICTDGGSLSVISPDERAQLADFFAIQLVRTPQYRLKWKQIGELIKTWLTEHIEDPTEFHSDLQEVIDSAQTAQIKAITDHKVLSAAFVNKVWILFKTTSQHPFWISDNPIVLQNIRSKLKIGSNLGLNVEGIEIYYPISKNYCIAMMCESNYEMYRRLLTLKEQHQEATEHLDVDWNEIENTYKGFQDGGSVALKGKVVDNINSLQVSWATRFVFSSSDQFSLAREMISQNPVYAKPPSIKSV